MQFLRFVRECVLKNYALIEEFILQKGYVPLKSYCGHGIGRKPHEEPLYLIILKVKAIKDQKLKMVWFFVLNQ